MKGTKLNPWFLRQNCDFCGIIYNLTDIFDFVFFMLDEIYSEEMNIFCSKKEIQNVCCSPRWIGYRNLKPGVRIKLLSFKSIFVFSRALTIQGLYILCKFLYGFYLA
jgi:hypothetical protein